MINLKNNNDVIVCEGEKESIVSFLNNDGYRNFDNDTPIMVMAYLIKDKYSMYMK